MYKMLIYFQIQFQLNRLLCCLFFDLWILITSLVSSSSHFSYIKETYSVFAQNIVGIFSGGDSAPRLAPVVLI
jgi:hypothetical protein